MKRRPRIIRELETSEAVLARLRADRVRLDREIAAMEERREADIQQFVMDATKRLKLAQLPAASILAALEQLAQRGNEDRLVCEPGGTSHDTSDDPRQELAEVFVRLTRNASAANREVLVREGLHWNGRSAGWSGRVTPEALQRLRDAFPDRVVGPDLESSAAQPEDNAGPAVEAEGPPISSPDAPPANLEVEAIAPAEDRAVAETVAVETAVPPTQPAFSAATRLLASPYRSSLPRRPLPT